VSDTGHVDSAVTPRGAGWLAFADTLLVVSGAYALATYGGRQVPGALARA
jgi:hypothetical protein